MTADPIDLQSRLAALLDRAHRDDSLRGEMARARREFFGADQPDYTDPNDERAMDAAAQRFAEWFLLERQSEVLGATPATLFGDPDGADAPLVGGRVGLFLVEASGDEVQVRDLEGGERLAVRGVPVRLRPGDVLVGRLFVTDAGTHVPSAALTVLAGSPHLAVAFQRDVRRLALDRRLNQAEIEHLVFQRWAAQSGTNFVGRDEPAPVERVEAELQTILDAAEVGEQLPATAISDALRSAGEKPGEVIGPLLDQIAFDTDVDLDRARELLLELSSAHRVAATARAERAAPTPPAATPEKTGGTAPKFRPRPGETLGEQLARRLDEGLAAEENVDEMFADVEKLLGESIDDDQLEEDATAGDPGLEDGDLEPLVREFVWETSPSAEDEAELAKLAAQQRAAPVPRTSVEYLDADDYLRFALQSWLAAQPADRPDRVRAAFGVVERFHDWLVDTQEIDLRERLALARRILVERVDDLQRASLAISSGTAVDAQPPAELARVVGRRDGDLEIEVDRGRLTCRVEADHEALDALTEGDLVLGPLAEPDGETVRFVGIAVVVPLEAEHLLG